MSNASYLQTSFLGGRWSSLAQGRIESQAYKTALFLSTNCYPIEQGTLVRRQGTRLLSETRRGKKAKLVPFDFSIVQPYQLELTDSFARFYMGTSRVYTSPSHSILNISTANPAVVTISDTMDWNTGDDVVFQLPGPPCRAPLLCNRQFTITQLTTSTFSIADAMTQAPIDGSTLNWSFNAGDKVFRILQLASPYTEAQLPGIKFVQDETTLTLMRTDVIPYVLQQSGTFFALASATFQDGPYYDENTTSTTFTPSGTSGSITITASSTTGINGGSGFLSTDVGRLIRLRSQPAAWNSGTTYAVGDLVTGTDGNIYTSLVASNINHNPINDIANWAPSASGLVWNWGNITVVTDTTHITVTLQGTTALGNTTATTHWRMGLYSATTGYPTCGGYHEDRLWFGGVVGNRFDATTTGGHSAGIFNFAPTAIDGTVADNNAIAGVFTAKDVNQILWFLAREDGLYTGTQAGEWRIRASALDDPITPSSIQDRRLSRYGSSPQQGLESPTTMLFVQRMKRKVLEYTAQGWVELGSQPEATNVTQTTPDVSVSGIEELVYQQEPTPMIWARRADGLMKGCSYKRTKDASFAAWHDVTLGSGRLVESMSVGPDAIQLGEALYLVTANQNDATKPRFVELLTPLFDDNVQDQNAWFVDTGIVPCCADTSGNNITFYGLHALEGSSLCPFIAGVDLGPHTVTNGSITVAYGSDPDGVFTSAYLAARSALNLNYGDYSVGILSATGAAPGPTVTSPSILAYVGTASGPTCVVGSVNGAACMPDWTGGNIYFYDAGTDSDDGLRQFLLDAPATNSLCVTRPTIGATEIGAASGGAFAQMYNNTLAWISTSGNSVQLGEVTVPGFTSFNTFGTAGASTSPSTASRLRSPRTIVPMTVNGDNYLVAEALGTDGEVWVKDITSSVFSAANGVLVGNATGGATSGTILTLCPGMNCAYALAGPNFPGGAANVSGAITLYRVTPSSLISIGSLSPSNVDAQWSTWFDVEGLAFDQVDGNLLTQVQTADVGASQKQYVIKINAITGALMWKAAVAGIDGSGDSSMWKSRIKTGTFLLPGGGGVQVINTRTGAVSTTAIAGLASMAGSISDDVSNSVIGFGGYSPGTLAYLGDWMATQGNHTVSNMFIRVFMGTIGGQDRSTLNALTIYTVGAPIGYCYTSQFQLLPPDGGDAGARNGPAFGKKRRNHWFAAKFVRTLKISFGTEFTRLHPFVFYTDGQKSAILPPNLNTGTFSTTITDDYSFKGQICGQVTTAYPFAISAISGYVETMDK